MLKTVGAGPDPQPAVILREHLVFAHYRLRD